MSTDSTIDDTSAPRKTLPLFPLQSVLFPGGLLSLKVFEARYLDLISECLRTKEAFGVVCLRQGTEVKQDGAPQRFEKRGVLAEVLDVDSEQPGILRVRCLGGQRFRTGEPVQEPDGLWRARFRLIDDDPKMLPTEPLIPTVRALANAIATLKQQGATPFVEPYRFDDAGWVANRWCELLPIQLAAKQKLMELTEPLVRLQLVDEYLRGKGVVS